MKAFLITTGSVFGLIVLAHIARAFAEGPSVAKDPVFILLTLLAAGLSAWSWRTALDDGPHDHNSDPI